MSSFKGPAGHHPSHARWNQLRFHVDLLNSDDNGVVTAQLADWTPRAPSPITITKVSEGKTKFSYADRNKLALGVKLARRDLESLRDSNQSLDRSQSLDNLASRPSNRMNAPQSRVNSARDGSKVDRLCKHKQPDKKKTQNRVTPRVTQLPKPPQQSTNSSSVVLPRRSLSPPVRDTDDWTPGSRKPLHLPTQRVIDNAQASKIRQLQQSLKKFEENMERMQLELTAERRESAIQAAKFKGRQPVQQRVDNKLKRLANQPVQYRTHKLYPPASTITLPKSARSRPPAMPREDSIEEENIPRGHHHFENRVFDPNNTAELEDVFQTCKKYLMAKGRYPSAEESARTRPTSGSVPGGSDRDLLLRNLILQNMQDIEASTQPPIKPALKTRRSPSPDNRKALYRTSAENLPVLTGGVMPDSLLNSGEFPQVDEVLYRLEQLERENEEIRKRWTSLPLEDLGVPQSLEGIPDRSIAFTKMPPAVNSPQNGSSLPAPKIPLQLNRSTVNRIVNDRNQFAHAMADRMRQSRFTVDVARIGEWLCDDIVDELLAAVVESIDSYGEELANQVFRGEVADSESELDEN